MRLGFVVLVRGPLRSHLDAVEDLWSRLQAGLLRKHFTRYRLGSDTAWTTLPESSPRSSFAELFEMRGPLLGRWGLELTEPGEDNGNQPTSIWLQFSDLAPVRGMERASHLRILFSNETSAATVAALGEWAVNRLPLWWGSAGFVFHHTTGTMFTAHTRMAALAKRYWVAQIQDMPSLQWDGLRGMPSVNWLSLIGEEFARSREMSLERVYADASSLKGEGVSHREGAYGVALAAGPVPLYGDINAGEAIDTYVSIARLIQPLLLTDHAPLFGPFAKPEVLAAWLGRFSAPRLWLECDITTD
jgi:hypothetical protein